MNHILRTLVGPSAFFSVPGSETVDIEAQPAPKLRDGTALQRGDIAVVTLLTKRSTLVFLSRSCEFT